VKNNYIFSNRPDISYELLTS